MSGAADARPLHPASLIVGWLRIVPQLAGGGAAYAAVVEGWGRILLVAAAAAAIGAAFAFLGWWRFRYRLGDGEIVIESGILNRQRRVIPFDRVQDIAIERRPIARLFGAAKVKIETGGSATDEGSLDMIGLADALALRDHIRRGQGQAEVPADHEPLLFEMTLGRVLYSGLFNFSLLFLAVMVAILENLDQVGLLDVEELATSPRADQAAGLIDFKVTLILVMALLVLGLLSGVIRTIGRDFGFRLTRGEAGFRRRRGLFTLSEVVIPTHRAQVAVIDSGPIARALGWYQLSFQTLGADRKGGGVQIVAPFAREQEMAPILTEGGFPSPPPRADFHRSPRRALVRRAAPFMLAALVAAGAAILIDARAGFGGAAMLMLGLVAILRWSRRSHAVNDQALFVTGGLLNRRLWIIPFAKAQTISLSTGPVQRALRLGSLLVDTAGASLIRPPEIADLDRADAEALGDRLLLLFHRARTRRRERLDPVSS